MKITSFDIKRELESLSGYIGLPFPGAYLPENSDTRAASTATYNVPAAEQPRTSSNTEAVLRKKDVLGRWYFMPVYLESENYAIEVPHAMVSVRCAKTIVKTPMVGLEGTVKELINLEDYHIRISGAIVDTDWPEEGINTLHDMFLVNAPLKMTCALTDIFLNSEKKSVVITTLDFPETGGIEHVQLFTMECISDEPFQLIEE